jgi:hypothetical protein
MIRSMFDCIRSLYPSECRMVGVNEPAKCDQGAFDQEVSIHQ